MKEQLIILETAKLAKEKGFNGTCYNFYPDWDNSDLTNCFEVGVSNTKDKSLIRGYGDILLVPTQSLLQKWIRDVHNIDILIDSIGTKEGYYFCIQNVLTGEIIISWDDKYFTFENCLEIGLQKALKLIKNEEN